MKIASDKIVGFHYTLTNDKGMNLDSSSGKEPLYYLHGKGSIIKGLEEHLEGKTQGDKLDVTIPPEKAYGVRDKAKVQEVPKSAFPKDTELRAGLQVQANSPDGGTIMLVVSKVEGDDVTVDGNHPLAGQHLNFKVEVTEVRDATKEELEHEHPHRAGGHEH